MIKKELSYCVGMLALKFYMGYFSSQESLILQTERIVSITLCITKGVVNEYGS